MKLLSILAILNFVLLFSGQTNYSQQPSEIRGGILNGKAKSLPRPEYPEELRMSGIEGTVKIAVTIDEEGNVISAEPIFEGDIAITRDGETIVERKAESPHPLLITPAQEAAMGAKFAPTMVNGNRVRVRGILVYRFVADRDEPPPPPPPPAKPPSMISGGVLNGKAISLPAPSYPPGARAVGAGGVVTVQIMIDESGDVVSATAVSGHPLLRSAATEAARAAKFAPITLAGVPVKVEGVVTYKFALPDGKNQ
jgi:TonB family protein